MPHQRPISGPLAAISGPLVAHQRPTLRPEVRGSRLAAAVDGLKKASKLQEGTALLLPQIHIAKNNEQPSGIASLYGFKESELLEMQRSLVNGARKRSDRYAEGIPTHCSRPPLSAHVRYAYIQWAYTRIPTHCSHPPLPAHIRLHCAAAAAHGSPGQARTSTATRADRGVFERDCFWALLVVIVIFLLLRCHVARGDRRSSR